MNRAKDIINRSAHKRALPLSTRRAVLQGLGAGGIVAALARAGKAHAGRWPGAGWAIPGGPLSQPLIASASAWTYMGAFTVPSAFDYGGWALALGPTQGSPPSGSTGKTLYISDNESTSWSMGAVYIPTDANIADPPTYTASSFIAPVTGTTIGSTINSTSSQIANGGNGLRLSSGYYDSANNRFIGTYYWYYPNSYSDGSVRNVPGVGNIPYATYNAYTTNPNLDVSSLTQNLQIGTSTSNGTNIDGSQFAGGMGAVGSEWQSYLGGTVLSSIGTLADNENRSSWGPCISAFTPSNLGASALPTTLISCYGNPGQSFQSDAIDSFTNAGWVYGDTGGQSAFNAVPANNYWSLSGAESLASTFAPSGYRTIVVAGTHCAGKYIYGDPTATSADSGKVEQTATFTATATNGSNVLTGVTVTSGTIAVGNSVCTIDANGFFTVLAGLRPANASDVASGISTKISAYDSAAQTITLSSSTPSSFVTGSYTFVANTGEVLAYDPSLLGGKGTFAYPYNFYVWYYDINDALSVISGAKNPWEILPYYVGSLPWPSNITTGQAARRMQGHGCFDPNPGDGSAGRLYMQITTSSAGGSVQIGVWKLQVA